MSEYNTVYFVIYMGLKIQFYSRKIQYIILQLQRKTQKLHFK